MKVLIILLLAAASASALNLRRHLQPMAPFYDTESRITNGLVAAPAQFPYQAGVSTNYISLFSSWCSGSLIAPDWVLTAAHCIIETYPVTVYLGNNTIASGTTVNVLEVIVHSGWNYHTKANDIALLRIPTVTLGTNIKVVPLPPISDNSNYLNSVAIVSGWGKTTDSVSTASALQYAYLKIVANSVCADTYGNYYVRDSNICVGIENGTSTCQGDSGDPLVDQKSGVLLGIFSFGGSTGCTMNLPIGFTRVSSYISWIKKIISA